VKILRCRSYAKINLHLQVIAARPDGYHELRTLFQTVDLHDMMTLRLRPEGTGRVSVDVTGESAPADERNLAVRAGREFLSRWDPHWDLHVELDKHIPVGGGLGGGSSNAATVLWALQRELGAPATSRELDVLAQELGADVPYFLYGGTAWATGRGDVIQPLEDLVEQEVWLVVPPVEVPTADVFDRLGELTVQPAPSSIIRLVQGGAGGGADRLGGWNDLEPIALANYPILRDVRAVLSALGAAPVQLSGSGATLFAFFRSPMRAEDLTGRLPDDCRVVHSRTLSRASFIAGRTIDD
jgi:4-diphosphocytidyl-2-C-methyl-D-erythritol kinase